MNNNKNAFFRIFREWIQKLYILRAIRGQQINNQGEGGGVVDDQWGSTRLASLFIPNDVRCKSDRTF